ncbi:MAG TPA: hypothetical protein VK550_16430 [Polyangiaceae bacterium]|nr:hypothetical protein [Polyangiaceae bacterium]
MNGGGRVDWSFRRLTLGALLLACACGPEQAAERSAPVADAAPSDAGTTNPTVDDARVVDTQSGSSLDASDSAPSPVDASGPPLDAGLPDTGLSFDCAPPAICDDFESAATGGPPRPDTWAIVTPNCSGTGQVSIDAAQARRGRQSLKVSGAGGYCNHVFVATPIAALGRHVFGRFFVRFAGALADSHVTFLAMMDSADSKDLRMGGQNRVLMWNREQDDATLPEMSPVGTSTSVAPKPEQWLCIELEIDGENGTITTSVDGSNVLGMTVDGTPTPDIDRQWLTRVGWRPVLTDLKLGWESYGAEGATLWFDDVAFATRRIGCDP